MLGAACGEVGPAALGEHNWEEAGKPQVVWKENDHDLSSKRVLYCERLHSRQQCRDVLQECLTMPCPAKAVCPTMALPSQGSPVSPLPQPELVPTLVPGCQG